MIDGVWLATTLRETPEKIRGWTAQAAQLRHLVKTAEIAGAVSDDLLTSAERTAGSVYEEITKVADIVANVAGASPEAAAQLAPITDALHLVLLEITELTTELYAVRSRIVPSAPALLS